MPHRFRRGANWLARTGLMELTVCPKGAVVVPRGLAPFRTARRYGWQAAKRLSSEPSRLTFFVKAEDIVGLAHIPLALGQARAVQAGPRTREANNS
jgi:hypothetical protein